MSEMASAGMLASSCIIRRSIGWVGKLGRVYFRFTLFRAALMTCRIWLRDLPYLPLSEAAPPPDSQGSGVGIL